MNTLSHLLSIRPFNPRAVHTPVEAVWSYLVLVACVTALSLITGTLAALMMSSGNAIFTMRLINGIVTAILAFRILRAKQRHRTAWLLLIPVAAVLSYAGYEVAGLAIVASVGTWGIGTPSPVVTKS
jgi:hypothetical protein